MDITHECSSKDAIKFSKIITNSNSYMLIVVTSSLAEFCTI